MASKPERRHDSTEILIAGRVFQVGENPPQAQVPLELLSTVLLSELPDEVAIKPLGVFLPSTPGQEVECCLYGFRDGYACARIQLLESGGPSSSLLALREAVSERQETQEDMELAEDSCQPGKSTVSFLLDIRQDLPVPEALTQIDRVLAELSSRRTALLANAVPDNNHVAGPLTLDSRKGDL
jgi:hypothetical protein